MHESPHVQHTLKLEPAEPGSHPRPDVDADTGAEANVGTSAAIGRKVTFQANPRAGNRNILVGKERRARGIPKAW
jgi:hypothetical protein